MKAITIKRYGTTEVLQAEELPVPMPKVNEVLVRVHASSVNDWDWNLMRGKPFFMRLFCGFF